MSHDPGCRSFSSGSPPPTCEGRCNCRRIPGDVIRFGKMKGEGAGQKFAGSARSLGVIGLVALLVAWCTNHYMINMISDHAHTRNGNREAQQEEGMVALSRSSGRAAQAAFRAVILGAPGSGKGTISARIVKQFNVSHISSGDKLRHHIAKQTALGKEVKQYLDTGALVPDETMIKLVSEEIKALGDQNWLLDGFPRTVSQAEALQKIHPVSLVINLDVPDSVIVDRIKNRWIHLASGRVYNFGFNDPKVPGKDDVTGEPLSQRPDDRPEVVQARLQQYASKTRPVISYYERLNVLRSFAGETTDSIWPKIRECVAQYA